MGRPRIHGKEQQTFRLSKPLIEALEVRCREEGMEKGEVVEALLRSAMGMPPPPDQEALVECLQKCRKDHFGSDYRLSQALSIVMGETIPATRLRGWAADRCIPSHVVPYIERLASVAAIVQKT
ncbi:hypothetical protein [Geothrix limicola]|uniref:hypothetical protein n=1 Tax=Geothrix limicola TaxID=2927978 RepID=UPI002555B618|nr:hypothetical protein [Geothrix limicola]